MNLRRKISAGMYVPLAICLTFAAATALFYLTPLRFFDPIDPSMHEVDAATLYKEMQAHPEAYLLLDVRGTSAYVAGHAPGAVSEPIPNLYEDRSVLPKTGKTIVLICTDGRSAAVAYGYLQRFGFMNLLHVTGGLDQWKVDGLPTIAGN